MWVAFFVKQSYMGDAYRMFSIFPRKLSGITGIVTSAFMHGDFKHLISNSAPLFILCFMLVLTYTKITYKVMLGVLLISGLGTWLIGREAYHLGASGVVYGLAFFFIFMGIFRKDPVSIVTALATLMLNGGLLYGLLPLDGKISWEGHLMGALSGIIMAFVYRKFEKIDKVVAEEDDGKIDFMPYKYIK